MNIRFLFLSALMTKIGIAASAQCTYTVPNVPAPIQQTSEMSCWAVAYTYLSEWKNNQTIAVGDAINGLGEPYVTIFQTDVGLRSTDKQNLITKAGLAFDYPASYTASAWCTLLQNHGPIWVTVDQVPDPSQPSAIHARVLYGISVDSSGNATMLFMDPASGTTVVEGYDAFVPKYEAEVKKIYQNLHGQPWPDSFALRIQIIYWP